MDNRKQINIRVDDDFLEVIGRLQIALADPRPPSMADAIRTAVVEALEKRDRKKPARA